MMIAEESTAWPKVTKPPCEGGLGFHYKWNMGWMHDMLNYCSCDFPYRQSAHSLLSFSMVYAFSENYILPFSHDEVVHGKGSLIERMPGDIDEKFAGLRTLALFQMTHPGAKLNFMGNEIAQFIEWRYYEGIEFFLAEEFERHRSYRQYIRELNGLYKKEKALWENDRDWQGFSWLDADNAAQQVIGFIRKSDGGKEKLVVILNFGRSAYDEYRIGVPDKGSYKELINSDSSDYCGSGLVNDGLLRAEDIPYHGQPYSICIKLPSLGACIFKKVKRSKC